MLFRSEISLRTSTATRTGTPDLSAINWFRIYATKSGSITTRIDDIRLGPEDLFSGLPNTNLKDGKSLGIYPNPHKTGKLLLELDGFDNGTDIQIQIYNISGDVVFLEKMGYNSSRNVIVLPQTLPESIYFVSVETDKLRLVEKLIRY